MTNIRKVLKQIRLDHCEVVKDMAERLGVSISFLCAVERGTRKIPKEIRNKIVEEYNFTQDQELLIDKAIMRDSNPIKINVKALLDIKKSLVFNVVERISNI